MTLYGFLVSLAMTGLVMWGFFDMEQTRQERKNQHETAKQLVSLRQGLFNWQSQTMDDTHPVSWDPLPTAADIEVFGNYLPRDDRTATPMTIKAPSTPPRFEFTNYRHGGGGEVVVEFDTTDPQVAHLSLVNPNGWDLDFVKGVQSYLPVARLRTLNELTISVHHPINQELMHGLARRYKTGGSSEAQGLLSPLTFEESAERSPGDPCGEINQMAVTADGNPLTCIEYSNVGGASERYWQPLLSAPLICRDTRLQVTHPDYNRQAVNMEVVARTSWAGVLPPPDQLYRKLRVRAIEITGVEDPLCPSGFRLDNEDKRFCLHQRQN